MDGVLSPTANLVRRGIKRGRILGEGGLSAVAVMDINVHDGHALDAILCLRPTNQPSHPIPLYRIVCRVRAEPNCVAGAISKYFEETERRMGKKKQDSVSTRLGPATGGETHRRSQGMDGFAGKLSAADRNLQAFT